MTVMGDTTTHGLPYPVGTDRVMDGDNAMQALAEAVDTALWAGAATGALAPGLWQAAVGVTICTASSLAAQPGTAVTRARWMKIGHTVWFQGEGTMSNAITDIAVLMPNSTAGLPAARVLLPGAALVVDSAGGPLQSGACVMHASKDRIMPITNTGAYVDAPSTSQIRWNIIYETTT